MSVARKRISGTKRQRDQARRERQEKKAQRRADRKAAKGESPLGGSAGIPPEGEADDAENRESSAADADSPEGDPASGDLSEGGRPPEPGRRAVADDPSKV